MGRKPFPNYLKIVTGNRGKRALKPEYIIPINPQTNNGMRAPKGLTKRQQELWNAYIVRAPWLTYFDVPKAHLWCMLQERFEKQVAKDILTVSLITQLRSLGSDLGFDPSARVRLANSAPPKDKDDKSDKYFT